MTLWRDVEMSALKSTVPNVGGEDNSFVI